MYEDEGVPEIPPVWRRFPEMWPVSQVPILFRILGTGTAMCGHRGHDAVTDTFVANHCLTILFIPIWAFAAFRVQRSPQGGYYFVGRVPLGVSSWAGNFAAFVAAAALVAGGTWWVYVGSPEMQASADLDRARALIEEEKLAEAAQLFQRIITSRASNAAAAREALAELTGRKDAPASEMAGVFRVAAALVAAGDEVVPDLFQRGHDFADQAMEKSPEDALAIAEVIAPLDPGLGAASQLEKRVLEPLVKRPKPSPDHVSRWAVLLADEGKENEARALLEPLRDTLGPRPAAAVLGHLALMDGKHEEARALIAPALDAILPRYREMYRKMREAQGEVWARWIRAVESRKAPGFDFEKYDRSGNDARQEMIRELINREWPNEAAARYATQAFYRMRFVQQAALDLGQAELHLAQKIQDPAQRQSALLKAEQAYLSVRNESRYSVDYLTQLGQAYYRMGKPAEGRKAFDEAIEESKRRKDGINLVSRVSQILRDLGAISEARKRLEQAYAEEKNEAAKRILAFTRSLSSIDLDDRLAWLEKCDQEDFEVKVSLLQARARKARQKGEDEQAEKLLRESLELYKGRDENGAYLNNSALVYFDLYDLTFDPALLKAGVERMEKALEKIPTSAVILRNVASSLLGVIASDVAGEAMDWKAMRQRPGPAHLAYLYDTEEGRKKLVEKFRAHPALPRVRSYLARLLVLAPRQQEAYSLLASLHGLLGEPEEMAQLAARLAKADVDTTDSAHESRELHSGKKDDKNKEELTHSVRRAREALESARERKGPTLAAALSRLSGLLIQLDVYSPIDIDEPVRLAEEAHKAAPSDATRGALAGALLHRAFKAVAAADPAFEALASRCKRSLGSYLLNWALIRGGPLRDKVLADPSFKRAVEVKAEQVKDLPTARGPAAWALLHASKPEAARALAQQIHKAGLEGSRTAIDLTLYPLHATAIMDRLFFLEMDGKHAEAVKLLRDKAGQGVPLPEAG